MFKNFFVILSLALSFILCGTVYAESGKMGCINMRKVFYEYKKTKDFNQKLEDEDNQVKKEMESRTQDIRKLRDEIDLLSESAKEKKQPELRQKLKELEDYRKEKVEGFIKKKDDMFKEVRTDIMNIAETYAKKNGYQILFDNTVFVYFDNNLDVTDDIVKELNE